MPRDAAPEDARPLPAGARLVDVREPVEFDNDGHAEGALLLPLSTELAGSQELDPARPVFIVCRTGTRARRAASILESRGFSDVRVVEGGMEAWKARGLPFIRRPASVWSLERQVRFTAGVLLVVSAAGGFLVHPALFLLGPALGAGLVYSAVTDTCGMAVCLMRLPWNRPQSRNTKALPSS